MNKRYEHGLRFRKLAVLVASCLALGACGSAGLNGQSVQDLAKQAVSGQSARYGAPEVVVGPLPFLGVHGLGVTPDGRLLAGSVVGQSISEVDVRTGKITPIVGPVEGEADDIAFGPNGELTWTAPESGKLRIMRDGKPVTIASDLPGMNSLAYSRDGRLYASQVFNADALWEFDPDMKIAPRKIAENMGGLNGFEVGQDGWIYAPIWFKGQVVRVNPDDGIIEVLFDDFKTPAAVNFGPDGKLYAVDTQEGRLYRLDVATREKSLVAQLTPSLDNLAIAPDGTIYVSNMADLSIHEVNPATGQVREITRSPLAAPVGLALVGNELHVADVFAYRSVNVETGQVSTRKRMWASDLGYPTAVSANADHVVLSSYATGTVQVMNRADGQTLQSVGKLAAPYDALELPDGSLLVAELGTDSILQLTGADLEQRAAVVSGIGHPTRLVLSKDGQTVFVATMAGDIWALQTTDWSRHRVAGELPGIQALTLAPNGDLLAVDGEAGRIVRIHPGSGTVSIVADGIKFNIPPFGKTPATASGIAVAENGDIYYTTTHEPGIYRIARRN